MSAVTRFQLLNYQLAASESKHREPVFGVSPLLRLFSLCLRGPLCPPLSPIQRLPKPDLIASTKSTFSSTLAHSEIAHKRHQVKAPHALRHICVRPVLAGNAGAQEDCPQCRRAQVSSKRDTGRRSFYRGLPMMGIAHTHAHTRARMRIQTLTHTLDL